MNIESIIASTSPQKIVNTTCCYCGVGCGVSATVENNTITSVKGDKQHPANEGRLCVKGSALHETQNFSNRLQQPLINGKPSSWEEAIELGAGKFKQVVDQYGPDAVAIYLSGQLLTEDYYIANKLMKGFIGTANVDTNSRLCMASAVVAHKRAFGEDLVPGCYDDLEQSDLLILVGSNMAYTHPVVYQRIVKAKKRRPEMTVVVLDPRRTPTCDIADIHLSLRPGADAFFFNGLLSYLADNNHLDTHFIEQHCNQFEQTLAAAKTQVGSTAQAAIMCDLNEGDLARVYQLFAQKQKAVTVFSQGINQSSSGVDKGNAIINCHLATGKIGKPGATPFSITGQPNAMGGREVGGLANQLAAHMNYGDAAALDKVKRFWDAPRMAENEGLKAVDMFQAIHDGKIKAVWIMATNPVVTMPDADFVREALRRCEMVIVSECVANTDTAVEADIVFPATTWGEKSGTVTNSERCISLQKGFLEAPGDTKNDWQIIMEFAKKMGFNEGFNYTSAADIFREHAALSGFENNGERAFNISALENLSDYDYFNLPPTYWPIVKGETTGKRRLFEDDKFFTDNGKANFIPVVAQFPKKPPQAGQLIMNTGRIRDQWHTMGRTGSSAKLVGHTDEPYIDIHPSDAKKLGLNNGDIALLENRNSRFLGRVSITDSVRRGETFVPMHWNNQFSASARADALVNSITDPLCGQPEFKHTPVSVKPFNAAWQGFLLTCEDITPKSEYWSKILLGTGFKYRLADREQPENWQTWIREQFPHVEQWSEVLDSRQQHYRALGFIEDKMVVALTCSIENQQKQENSWLESHLGKLCDSANRFTLLAGAPANATEDTGKAICSCFQTGENTIIKAIEGGCDTIEKLGEKLKCGTNCGSCVPELNALIQNTTPVKIEASQK